ncbi:MAG: ribokinase [Bacteroidales bacterium]|nr:ribokinase [Bacteroidales bacterium]
MDKKPKILVVGSFIMDLVATADRAPAMGETVIGTSFKTAPGGKGANQAVQAARLGVETHMAGCVGDDVYGQIMLQALNSSGVDTRRVKISHEHPSGIGHIRIQTGGAGVQNSIIVVPGANFDLKPADMQWLEAEIGGYDMVIMQLEIDMQTIEYVAGIAKAAGVPVMLNTAPAAPLSNGLLSKVTFISPNETEASLLSGVKTDAQGRLCDDALRQAASVLMGKGVPNVIITLGDDGAALCAPDGVIHVPCVRMTDVKDPTAAGDSFVGAFCAGYVSGLSIDESISLAVHTAAITVCGFGAIPSLPTIDKVKELLKERGCNELLNKLK